MEVTIDLLSGTAGGVASVYVGQPLDTVKVKMQTFPKLYPNAFMCFKKTLTTDGIFRGLYAGTVPSLAAQVSENAVLFMAYGMCQKGVMMLSGKGDTSRLNVLEKAAAGSLAGFFAAIVLCPTELVKCKLQAMREVTGMDSKAAGIGGVVSKHKMSPVTVTRDILVTDGIRGFYRGMVPTLAREVFGYSFFFGGYELCKILLTPPGGTPEDLSPWRTILCGGAGGLAFWAAVFPADVIKSRAQVQGHSQRNISFLSMMVHIGKTEGIGALYKGLSPTLARTVPASGALFLAFESTKKYLTAFTENH